MGSKNKNNVSGDNLHQIRKAAADRLYQVICRRDENKPSTDEGWVVPPANPKAVPVTPEDVKLYLYGLKELYALNRQLENRISYLRENIAPATSNLSRPVLSKVRGVHADPTSDLVERIHDLKEKSLDIFMEIYILKTEIILACDSLKSDRHREAVQYVFIDDMTIRCAAEKMDVTERHVKKLLAESYEQLAEADVLAIELEPESDDWNVPEEDRDEWDEWYDEHYAGEVLDPNYDIVEEARKFGRMMKGA